MKPSPTTLGVNGTLPIPFVVSPDTIGIMSALRTMHMAATALQMPPFLKAAAEESRASQANACRVRPDPLLRLRMAMRSCCLGKPKCHREGLAGNNVSRSARSFGFAQDDIGGAGAYESQRIGITALSGPVEPRPPRTTFRPVPGDRFVDSSFLIRPDAVRAPALRAGVAPAAAAASIRKTTPSRKLQPPPECRTPACSRPSGRRRSR